MFIPNGNTLHLDIYAKFDDVKVKTRELFRSIEKVSLMKDTSTTINCVGILGMTIH